MVVEGPAAYVSEVVTGVPPSFPVAVALLKGTRRMVRSNSMGDLMDIVDGDDTDGDNNNSSRKPKAANTQQEKLHQSFNDLEIDIEW